MFTSSLNLLKTSRCVCEIGSYFNDGRRIKDKSINKRRLKTIRYGQSKKIQIFSFFYINRFVI